MPVAKRKHRQALKKAGFRKKTTKKHEKWVLRVGDQLIAETQVSKGSGEISDHLLQYIRRDQLHLEAGDYGYLVSCDMTQEEYFQILREKGQLLDN